MAVCGRFYGAECAILDDPLVSTHLTVSLLSCVSIEKLPHALTGALPDRSG